MDCLKDFNNICYRNNVRGNSLVVQWLGLHASTAGGMGLIPGWGTEMLCAAWCSQKTKKGNNVCEL